MLKKKIILILVSLTTLMSCLTPQQKLERLINKYPYLLTTRDSIVIKSDSLYKIDTLVDVDTLYKLIDKHCDTSFQTRTIIKKIKGGCNPSDSILIDSSGLYIKAVYSKGVLKLKYKQSPFTVAVHQVKNSPSKYDHWFYILMGYAIFATLVIVLVIWKTLR